MNLESVFCGLHESPIRSTAESELTLGLRKLCRVAFADRITKSTAKVGLDRRPPLVTRHCLRSLLRRVDGEGTSPRGPEALFFQRVGIGTAVFLGAQTDGGGDSLLAQKFTDSLKPVDSFANRFHYHHDGYGDKRADQPPQPAPEQERDE
jgi:hypothetical protein